MAVRSSISKPPSSRRRSPLPLALLVSVDEQGHTISLGQESREVAEAALPPSAAALEVLRASRSVHRAETALRSAAGEEELRSLRSSLEQAEQVLRAAIESLGAASDGAN